MSTSETISEPENCHNGNKGKHQEVAACACCAALAQVRMPWVANMQVNGAGTFQQSGGSTNGGTEDTAKKKKPKKTLFDLFTAKKHTRNVDAPHEQEPEWDEELLGPRPRKLWQGIEGMAVTLFGIAIPALLFLATCMSMPKRISLVLINHPLETLAEVALIVSLPVMNYLVWSELCKSRYKPSRASATALGAATMSSLVVAAVCIGGMFAGGEQMMSGSGTDFSIGFAWLALLSLLGAAASGFIIYRVRATREFATTKQQVLVYSSIGAMLALAVIVVAEARPWLVRHTEYMAVSADPAEARKGLTLLRQLYPERELRMECADSRAAGLSGLFIPVKPGSQRNLYFAMTGKPYSFHETNNVDLSSMPDDYVKNNIVGEEVKGLSLARSNMEGTVHPRTMSANIVWTMVFKNDTAQDQEARTEIALPPGAIVNDVLAWSKGEMRSASFFAAAKVAGVSGNTELGHDNSATVSDLGHGRVLMHAYPVPPEGEYKIAVSIVLPLKANNTTSGSFTLPGIVSSNFGLNGEHAVSLKSSVKMESDVKPLAVSVTGVGDEAYSVTGSMAADQLKSSRNRISVARPVLKETVAVMDRIATKMARNERLTEMARHKEENKDKLREIERLRDLRNDVSEFADAAKTATDQIDDIRRTLHKNSMPPVKPFYNVVSVAPASSAAPKHLVVVIDGSATTREYIDQIRAALSKLPKDFPTEVVVASRETKSLGTPVPLAKALESLRDEQFIGGQDNVKTIVTAAQLAGKTRGGAVLWLHGPQPLTNQEIYIISKYTEKPTFYDMTLGSGDTDAVSLFANNPEIGPFEEVPQHAESLDANLSAFVASWKPGNTNYAVSITQTDAKPDKLAKLSRQEENEVLWLWANNRCDELILEKRLPDAATMAAKYGFVSPVSYASIASSSGTDSAVNSEESSESGAPRLQGATNGTIGPQEDATVISGVNTACTVRVNNLANLEALLNIVANIGEVILGLGGAIFIICGLIEGGTTVELMGQEIEVTRGQRLVIGATMIILGVFTPAVINYVLACARDANLFS